MKKITGVIDCDDAPQHASSGGITSEGGGIVGGQELMASRPVSIA